jgi:hypothetical protein
MLQNCNGAYWQQTFHAFKIFQKNIQKKPHHTLLINKQDMVRFLKISTDYLAFGILSQDLQAV